MEMSEDGADFVGVFWALDGVVGTGGGDGGDGAPIVAIAINGVVFAVFCGNNAWQLPDTVGETAFVLQALVHEGGHVEHIFHHPLWFFEDIRADALKEETLFTVHRSEDGLEGFVDIARTSGIHCDKASCDLKPLRHEGCLHGKTPLLFLRGRNSS